MSDNNINNRNDGPEYLKRLKRFQTLVMVALIGGPVSLLIGGIPLSTAGVICSFIAFTNLSKLGARAMESGSIEKRLYIQSIVALAICVITLISNAIFFADIASKIIDAANSGTLDAYMNSIMNGTEYVQSGSVWNR